MRCYKAPRFRHSLGLVLVACEHPASWDCNWRGPFGDNRFGRQLKTWECCLSVLHSRGNSIFYKRQKWTLDTRQLRAAASGNPFSDISSKHSKCPAYRGFKLNCNSHTDSHSGIRIPACLGERETSFFIEILAWNGTCLISSKGLEPKNTD